MRNLAHDSKWSGLAHSLKLSWVLVITGCTVWPAWLPGADDHALYLARAMAANAPKREALWQESLKQDRGYDAKLRKALLQSLPNHEGYNLEAAVTGLRSLSGRSVPGHVSAIARLRLEELKASKDREEEITTLKERLSKIADIERQTQLENR